MAFPHSDLLLYHHFQGSPRFWSGHPRGNAARPGRKPFPIYSKQRINTHRWIRQAIVVEACNEG